MRVLVTGSRTWTYAATMRDRLARLPRDATIVVGDARGADAHAIRIARNLGLNVEIHRADWSMGRRAGLMRNLEMLDYPVPDLVLAFWDGESRGTRFTFKAAQARRIPTEVLRQPPPTGSLVVR